MIVPAQAALSDSMLPCIEIVTRFLQMSECSLGKPLPSFPITTAHGLSKSNSVIFSPFLTTAAFVTMPSSSKSVATFRKLSTTKRSSLVVLPIAERTTFGLYRSTQLSVITTPLTPTASAVLRSVPKLPGSCKLSSTRYFPFLSIYSATKGKSTLKTII